MLEGCDDIQLTEDDVLCITKEENKSHNSSVAKLTVEDKENLFAIALLGEREKERENNSSFGKSGKPPLKRKNEMINKSFELQSPQGCLVEQQDCVLEVLTQILGISQSDSMEWKEKIATSNTVVSIQIHEGKVSGDLLSNEQAYYCKVGLVSIREMKTKSRLDDVSSDVKATNTVQSIGEPKWNESFDLTLGNEIISGLCVEVWNANARFWKMINPKKTKGNVEPKLEKTLVGAVYSRTREQENGKDLFYQVNDFNSQN